MYVSAADPTLDPPLILLTSQELVAEAQDVGALPEPGCIVVLMGAVLVGHRNRVSQNMTAD